jgi:SWI/SNF-related matrix-associated actin-dependent regulator 1 of chromatin subfamily A
MIITTKFPSTCKVCGRKVEQGDRVSWVKGERGVAHVPCSEEGKALAQAVEASRATDSDREIPAPDGLAFLPYQKAGIDFALNHNGTIIGDDMGLGKTIQGIGVVNADESIKRVLVICPASLKLNWRNEFRKWCSRRADITVFPDEAPPIDDAADVGVVIANYDQLKKLPVVPYDLVIVDEAHYVKNPKAQRTKYVHAICKRARRKILLSGTPIANRPIELWSLLQIVDPERWDPPGFNKGRLVGAGEGAGFFRFAKRYCDAKEVWHGRTKHWDFTGASNLPELQEKLRSTCMIRRLKSDVLKDLPPKRRRILTLSTPVDEGEAATFAALGLSYDDAIDTLSRDRVAFTELSKARHETAFAKIPAAIDYVNEVLETSDKVILFAHHQDVIDELEKGLFGHGVVTITGATANEARQIHVERFQNDPGTRIILGSIGAMGVGHTLTASSHVIFAEQSWVPSEMTQAEDRAHRIGQRNSVLVDILVADGSVDANMMQTVIAKQEVADLALDNRQPGRGCARASRSGRHRPRPYWRRRHEQAL